MSELATPPLLVKPVKQGLYYFMEHAHDQFYILTNYGQDKEFKVRAPVLCISYKTIFTTDNDSY